MWHWICMALLIVCSIPVYGDDVPLYPGTVVRFASLEEGVRIITTRDDYISSLSPFDRQSKCTQSQTPVTEEEFLDCISYQVREWSPEEITDLSNLISQVVALLLEDYSLNFPEVVYLVRTSGNEEANSYYTRQNAIFIPFLPVTPHVLVHELFHVLSRNDPELRQRLYRIIGFYPTLNEVELPTTLQEMKISNPDAPFFNNYINVEVQGVLTKVVPLLHSPWPYQGGTFMDYWTFSLLAIEEADSRHVPVLENGNPVLYTDFAAENVTGFFEQIGNNTTYIIHPEEILADNFVLMVLQAGPVQTPRILDEMRAILTGPPVSVIEEWERY